MLKSRVCWWLVTQRPTQRDQIAFYSRTPPRNSSCRTSDLAFWGPEAIIAEGKRCLLTEVSPLLTKRLRNGIQRLSRSQVGLIWAYSHANCLELLALRQQVECGWACESVECQLPKRWPKDEPFSPSFLVLPDPIRTLRLLPSHPMPWRTDTLSFLIGLSVWLPSLVEVFAVDTRMAVVVFVSWCCCTLLYYCSFGAGCCPCCSALVFLYVSMIASVGPIVDIVVVVDFL